MCVHRCICMYVCMCVCICVVGKRVHDLSEYKADTIKMHFKKIHA